ncbi:glycosyltransferase [Companilactobacillus jidongensis]|uniref:glycosyltransferase n=1 Tax=Companilactobacillus jidongensis TaxID=2486006 RepID=UPI000F7B3A1D|nr:glycosyltransferase [Companilactobacillus jidongensis]
MNILYCGDSNIKDGLLISILSLIKNTNGPFKIYVLTADIKTSQKEYYPIDDRTIKYLDSILKKSNQQNNINKIDITNLFDSNKPTANMQTIFTPGCMLRLYADQVSLLPARILYLDTDVICRKDFSDYYYQNLNGYEVAGVLDYYGKWLFHNCITSFDYLNSGIMLLNLEMIRRTGLFRKCRTMCRNEKMFMPDQSSLNKLTTTKKVCGRRFNEQRKLHKNTVFQHFTTSFRLFPWIHTLTVKPWQVDEMHSKLGLYEYDSILNQYQNLKENL